MAVDIVLFEPSEKDKEIAKKLGFERVYSFDEVKKNVKIVEGGDDDTNRKAVENKNVDILLNPHNARTRDFMHYRNCGLNHILCKLAFENGVAIGFSLDRMYLPDDLGRVMFAVKLCRKYKNKTIVFSLAKNVYGMRAVRDIISYLTVVGFDSEQANNAFGYAEEIIKINPDFLKRLSF